ncbi:leucine rich adaptor protein 1-like isoform X2 [Monodelphis domestica]|uniref:Leucine rich adaptor protein 1 like n=2 Tax=Monodelphis domestica TaxID=13616 RepID=F7FUY5_MONDO|nr:leucine rich adaptor protein 1-like isoform X2 [Monodelphis domestica]
MEESPLPDLRDIELKLGRKVPESLVRSLRGEEPGRDRDRDKDKDKDQGRGCSSSSNSSSNSCSLSPSSSSSSSSSPASGSPRRSNSSALERLETKLHLLKQEMVNLRATDVRLMRQLLIINDSIESIKWMMEEKGTITSRGSSLSGSLCSLLESQNTSLQGSYNSLQDCSDGLDGISVGSYLDTLADDVPGHQTPSDLDQFSDTSLIEDSQSLHKHSKFDSEYYRFG